LRSCFLSHPAYAPITRACTYDPALLCMFCSHLDGPFLQICTSSEIGLSYSFWGEEAPPDWGADSKFSETIQGMLSITPETNHKSILVIGLDAILSSGPASLTHPLARCPQRLLHLAALGHFQAIQRVAMRAEKSSHKVVAATIFATSSVKLLPPVLVVTSILIDSDDFVCVTFAWLCTNCPV